MKQWKCTVCGYVHTGDEPPETCPVCGADKSKFVELSITDVEDDGEDTEPMVDQPALAPPETRKQKIVGFVHTQMLKHHAHPISAHIPNGVLPVAVAFLFISLFLNVQGLRLAAFYNMIVVAIAMPAVLYSGYNEWQKRYSGNFTPLFIAKMVCGGVVLAGGGASVIWSALAQDSILLDTQHRWMFLMLHIVILSAAGIAGFLGGKLVFKD
jgi:hypothetical protein